MHAYKPDRDVAPERSGLGEALLAVARGVVPTASSAVAEFDTVRCNNFVGVPSAAR